VATKLIKLNNLLKIIFSLRFDDDLFQLVSRSASVCLIKEDAFSQR